MGIGQTDGETDGRGVTGLLGEGRIKTCNEQNCGSKIIIAIQVCVTYCHTNNIEMGEIVAGFRPKH